MNASALRKFCDAAGDYTDWMNRACARFEITKGARLQMFLAQFAYESRGFTRMEESFRYTHAERLARVFRRSFDTDHDGDLSSTEIEAAAAFCINPGDSHAIAFDKEQALANKLYAGRYGNGDEASGDGWRYRGRAMGVTFKANYAAASEAIYASPKFVLPESRDQDGQLLTGPDLLLEPEGACLASAWFWTANGCNQLADMNDFDGTTHRINPPMEGAPERRDWLELAQEVFP